MYSIYRAVSPYLKSLAHNLGLSTGRCRYTPTCSQYAKQSFSKYGIWKGAWLSVQRLLKCHPWSSGGYDPVHFKRDSA